MLRRIGVALLALLFGVALSAALLAYSRAGAGSRTVLAIGQDLPAGALLDSGSLREVKVVLEAGQAAVVVGAERARSVVGTRTRHELAAGQLLQVSDLQPASGAPAGEVLLVLPLKDLPAVRPGDRLDLFALSGTGDRTVAQPFAWSVPVDSSGPSGVVLRVAARQELAFVYAAGSMRLVAVVNQGSSAGGAGAISSPEQAIAVAAR